MRNAASLDVLPDLDVLILEMKYLKPLWAVNMLLRTGSHSTKSIDVPPAGRLITDVVIRR